MSISSQWWMLAETIVRHERDDPGALMSDVHENAKKTGNHAVVCQNPIERLHHY